MSLEVTVVCDHCARGIGSGPTGKDARDDARAVHPGGLFSQPGGEDFCDDCVEQGRHKPRAE